MRNLIEVEVTELGQGLATLRTAEGIFLRAKDDGGYRSGATVLVGIRPERMRLDGLRDGDSRLDGTLDDEIYLGDRTDWRVKVGELILTVAEAAADLGATPLRRLWRVTLPLTAPGMAAGCLLVFIPSLGAFLAPDLLGGGRAIYVGNLVQSQFAVARDMPFGAALSFLLTVTVLAVQWLFRRPLRAASEA